MKKVLVLVLTLMLALSAAAHAAPMVMRLAEVHAPDYPTTLGNFEFARLVEERTNGRIKIEVYPGGQLGDETAVVQELVLGTIEFCRVSVSPVTEFSPGLNAIILPFLYRDSDHMWKVLNGPIGDDLLGALESGGLVGLTWYDAGARSFYTVRNPIRTVAEFAGLKFRMQDSRLMMGIVTALGGNPISMPTGDTYSAMQTGVVDGAENNIPSYDSFGHYEVAPYFTLTEHSRVPELLMMSKQVMDRLPAEDQAIIKQAARDTQAFQIQKWAEREVQSLEKVKQSPNVTIFEVTPEEWAKFAAAMEPLHAEFGRGYEGIIEQIKNTQ